ncbi:MAG: creatininase family protein [Deltaproteobacteria bacterium]|jgi:creatinine amidohydrolase/Fe(II)-dependent formamide hydrolase-like protein|nr:creatininase family protein [Deltaproteobacteria bacterium]MBW2532347.1 creatininase family protein [Deltaproteobacteria bacterium]
MSRHREALARLRTFDRLEVGPTRVEAQRLVTPYTVVRGGTAETMELIYKYEEPVFDPDEPASVNLAAMIGAQVALNYGLFAREIVFRGLFDAADRRFIEEMARNTAREIYVNKLLMPNPLLEPGLEQLPAERLSDFLGAKLRFARAAGGPRGDPSPWQVDTGRHAVLSSGGKDSLLTYGLLAEIGREVHPVFVNESGRHWYTALNGYRHLAAADPNTARVWTNSDRLFPWLARRLGIVRRDFDRRRSDEYPIRLWTVAVFLFGALPVLRRRGVGRLLVGDEFDTTVRGSFRGIPHYNGLYDQSRYFDSALTRYFKRKRFGLSQFSALRPLSELLIEKILVERYPELQRQQMSCHAAHMDGERVRPCGKCEKCRRIVGMLSALGADPRTCGYTGDQIDGALRALATLGVHQELAGSRQMSHMLVERGLLDAQSAAGRATASAPEVLQLRFDREHSPLDTMPVDLRRPLYEIYLEHAAGATRRSGRMWVEFDPLGEESLAVPYRFEHAGPEASASGPATGFLLAEMTWPMAREALRGVDVALLPVGALEQHGPHLPLDVDAYDADQLCREVAAACSLPPPLVLPVVPYGVSYHHDDFAGTISVSPATLSRIVHEIGLCVARQGITKLVIVNGHGGNGPALHFAAQLINRDARIFTTVDSGESSDVEIDAITTTPNDVHAGEVETSTTLARRPHLVHMGLAEPNVPRFSSEYLDFSSRKGVGWYVRTARLSGSGVLGDPTRASAEKGEKIWEIWVRSLVELVEYLKGATLDEIHQRRY